MTLGTILLIVLFLFLLGALPRWPHSRSWGYYPSGGFGLLLLILIVFGLNLLFGLSLPLWLTGLLALLAGVMILLERYRVRLDRK